MLQISLGLVLLIVFNVVKAQTFDDAYRLHEYLLNGSRYIRPLRNQSMPIEIVISHHLSSVEHVDIARGLIETTGFLNLSWTAETLAWEPSLFGGIRSIHVPAGMVWHPELIVYGAADKNDALTNSKFPISSVNYEGVVQLYHLGNLIIRCLTDTTLFPFDSHSCTLQLYAYKYSELELHLRTPSPFVDAGPETAENYEWEILENSSKVAKIYDPSSVVGIFKFDSRLVIRRRATFVILHQFIPCILIVCLNLFTCFVPLNSGERLSYSVTIFLAFVFFMDTMVESLPKSSLNISVSSYAFVTINGINALTVIWSVICVRLSTMDSQIFHIPVTLRKLVQWKVGRNNRVTNEEEISKETKPSNNRDDVSYDHLRPNANDPNLTTKSVFGKHELNNRKANEANISYNTVEGFYSCSNVSESGLSTKENTAGSVERNKCADTRGEPNGKISWFQVAMCLDKLYFAILLLSIIMLLVISCVRFHSEGGFN